MIVVAPTTALALFPHGQRVPAAHVARFEPGALGVRAGTGRVGGAGGKGGGGGRFWLVGPR